MLRPLQECCGRFWNVVVASGMLRSLLECCGRFRIFLGWLAVYFSHSSMICFVCSFCFDWLFGVYWVRARSCYRFDCFCVCLFTCLLVCLLACALVVMYILAPGPFFFIGLLCSTSPSGGNQVDGLPPAPVGDFGVLKIEFSEGFRYQIEISYGERLHYISNKISAKYELQRILVSRFWCDVKLSGHFAKKKWSS